MTYSIVARDHETGELGVAVQTCMPAVGAKVPFARAGVGAVASQASAEPSYGRRCLDSMSAGSGAAEALDSSRSVDPGSAHRQVGVVSADGSAEAFTGSACIDHAGHVVGDGFTVQANMMASPRVWPAMADAYTGASGPLARRMLAALEAAQAAGGDARGMMSAAILVVSGQPDEPEPIVDLRVDRSDDPITQMARLLDVHNAYAHLFAGAQARMAGDLDGALSELDEGLALLPDEGNLLLSRAVALLARGEIDAARDTIRELTTANPNWATVLRGFVALGIVVLPEGTELDGLLQ